MVVDCSVVVTALEVAVTALEVVTELAVLY